MSRKRAAEYYEEEEEEEYEEEEEEEYEDEDYEAERPQQQQQQLIPFDTTKAAEKLTELKYTLALYAYDAGIPFRAFLHPTFEHLCNRISAHTREPLQAPTLKEFEGEFLERAWTETSTRVNKNISDMSVHPSTLVVSGGPVLNIMFASGASSENLFYDSFRRGKYDSADDYVLDEICTKYIDVINSNQKPEKVFSVILDKCVPDCMAACSVIESKYPRIWSFECQSRALILVLSSWNMLPYISDVVERGFQLSRLMVTVPDIDSKYRQVRLKKLELQMPLNTEFMRSYLCLRRLQQMRISVQHTLDVVKSDLTLSKVVCSGPFKRGAATASDDGFWRDLDALLSLWSIFRVAIRMFDRNSPALGKVYGVWLKIIHTLEQESVHPLLTGERRREMAEIVKAERSIHGSSIVFGAGYCLNPEYREVMKNLTWCDEPLAELRSSIYRYYSDQATRRECEQAFDDYRFSHGHWNDRVWREGIDEAAQQVCLGKMEAWRFWSSWGTPTGSVGAPTGHDQSRGEVPESTKRALLMQEFAVRVLSQVAGNSARILKWREFRSTMARNGLPVELRKKLEFRFFNEKFWTEVPLTKSDEYESVLPESDVEEDNYYGESWEGYKEDDNEAGTSKGLVTSTMFFDHVPAIEKKMTLGSFNIFSLK